MPDPRGVEYPTVATVTETAADGLRARFEELLALWQRDTMLFSDPDRIFGHPAFDRIVALGDPAVPLILEKVHKGSVFLCAALHAITGAEPAADDDTSLGFCDAWTRWGQAQGLLAAGCGEQLRLLAGPATVADLIETLQHLPGDLPIAVDCPSVGVDSLSGIQEVYITAAVQTLPLPLMWRWAPNDPHAAAVVRIG